MDPIPFRFKPFQFPGKDGQMEGDGQANMEMEYEGGGSNNDMPMQSVDYYDYAFQPNDYGYWLHSAADKNRLCQVNDKLFVCK